MANKEEMIQALETKVRNMSEDSPTGGFIVGAHNKSRSREQMIRRYNRNVVGDWKASK